jgi:carboxyl-terminal processing protease
MAVSAQDRRALDRQLDLFTDVVALIQTDYVDEVPVQKLFAGALTGMLRSLDPYSQYLDADAYNELKVDTQGEFGGLGLEISVKGGAVHVIAPLDDSPASDAGMKAGDTIMKIDDTPTRDMSLTDAVKRLRGKPGSVVRLVVMRESESKMREVSLTRATINVRSVKDAKVLDGGIGYLRLSSFQERSPDDFDRALKKLEEKGLNGLVIDVRNDAGGLLSAAVDVTGLFIPDGGLIVETRGRGEKKIVKFFSKTKSPHRVRPMVVLVNKGSASGSEILAGALQDYGLATVVGTKTFGKASVQTLVPLPDGAAIRITTSKYYTPKGRLLHEVGITPDVVVEGDEGPDKKDPQLERALEIVRRHE